MQAASQQLTSPSLSLASATTTGASSSPGSSFICKWDGCHQLFPDLRALSEHVLILHVGWQTVLWPWAATQQCAGSVPQSSNTSVIEQHGHSAYRCISKGQHQHRHDANRASIASVPVNESAPGDPSTLLRTTSTRTETALHKVSISTQPQTASPPRPMHSAGSQSPQEQMQNPPSLPPIAELFPPLENESELRAQPQQKGRTRSSASDGDAAGPPKFKPRRKWRDDETQHLLRGVQKHGIGNWTKILNDEEFHFSDRTGTELKDKFRTCFPNASKPVPLASSFIGLNLDQERAGPVSLPNPAGETMSATNPRRRKKQHFSDRDDSEILEGLRRYGPSWTRIQRDAAFHLACRRPMDLRDRVRNQFPELYQRLQRNLRIPKKKREGDGAATAQG